MGRLSYLTALTLQATLWFLIAGTLLTIPLINQSQTHAKKAACPRVVAEFMKVLQKPRKLVDTCLVY